MVQQFLLKLFFLWKDGGKKIDPSALKKGSNLNPMKKQEIFLIFLGSFCESVNRYPDISFGKTYANITIRPSEDYEKQEISKIDHEFANQIDLLINK